MANDNKISPFIAKLYWYFLAENNKIGLLISKHKFILFYKTICLGGSTFISFKYLKESSGKTVSSIAKNYDSVSRVTTLRLIVRSYSPIFNSLFPRGSCTITKENCLSLCDKLF